MKKIVIILCAAFTFIFLSGCELEDEGVNAHLEVELVMQVGGIPMRLVLGELGPFKDGGKHLIHIDNVVIVTEAQSKETGLGVRFK